MKKICPKIRLHANSGRQALDFFYAHFNFTPAAWLLHTANMPNPRRFSFPLREIFPMVVIGYIAAILIGLSLGMVGGGGSIITVPVLVYLMGVDPVLATAYSLFVVGACSLVGSIRSYRKGLIDFPVVFVFGGASMLSVFITRHFLLPKIPDHIATIGKIAVRKGNFLMLLFACLMLVTSVSMIRSGNTSGKKLKVVSAGEQRNMLPLLLQGIGVGIVTGLLGAGGGFLIIPALVLFGKLPMKEAVGSSLTIMTFSSLFGFFSTSANHPINWWLLISFTAVAVSGIFIGTRLGDRVSGAALKKGFGWFVFVMGCYVLFREILQWKS